MSRLMLRREQAASFFKMVTAAGLMVSLVQADGSTSLAATRPSSEISFHGNFTQVAVSDQQSSDNMCAVRTDGSIACPSGSIADSKLPPGHDFVQVSVGNGWACGLKGSGTPVCWNAGSPQETPPPGHFVQLSAGPESACAVRRNGRLACWGYIGDPGELGPPPKGTFTQVSVGGGTQQYQYIRWACAVKTGGQGVCWGQGADSVTPAPAGRYVQISVDFDFACGLRVNESIVCWGPGPPVARSFGVAARYRYTAVSGDCGLRLNHLVQCQGQRHPVDSHRYKQFSMSAFSWFCGVQMDGKLSC